VSGERGRGGEAKPTEAIAVLLCLRAWCAPAEKLDKLPELKPARSVCLLNASKSGFWSRGIIRGDAAAAERTLEVGGLQFARACCPPPDDMHSSVRSMERPK
jgi:hypothetical protein